MTIITDPAVAAYRAANPHSRAVQRFTWWGSTYSVRRATCVACRREIGTCSSKWPTTKQLIAAIAAHTESCEAWHRYQQDNNNKGE